MHFCSVPKFHSEGTSEGTSFRLEADSVHVEWDNCTCGMG